MTGVDATNRPRAYQHRITPGHFATLGMRFVDGRDFTLSEMGVESTAVDRHAEGGRSLLAWPERRRPPHQAWRSAIGLPWLTIVGVVEDATCAAFRATRPPIRISSSRSTLARAGLRSCSGRMAIRRRSSAGRGPRCSAPSPALRSSTSSRSRRWSRRNSRRRAFSAG